MGYTGAAVQAVDGVLAQWCVLRTAPMCVEVATHALATNADAFSAVPIFEAFSASPARFHNVAIWSIPLSTALVPTVVAYI